jgi:hypothetical protein
MIAALVTDTDPEKHSINFSDMSGRTVGPGWGPMTPPSRTAGTKQRSSVGVSDQVPTLGSDYRLGHGY